jgi:Cu-Zn family superoxide dismutase
MLRIELLAPNVRLGAGAGTLFDGDGAALVIHALADDYQTDPAGASGPRIACAVLER